MARGLGRVGQILRMNCQVPESARIVGALTRPGPWRRPPWPLTSAKGADGRRRPRPQIELDGHRCRVSGGAGRASHLWNGIQLGREHSRGCAKPSARGGQVCQIGGADHQRNRLLSRDCKRAVVLPRARRQRHAGVFFPVVARTPPDIMIARAARLASSVIRIRLRPRCHSCRTGTREPIYDGPILLVMPQRAKRMSLRPRSRVCLAASHSRHDRIHIEVCRACGLLITASTGSAAWRQHSSHSSG